jgi:hypothetical protein
VANERRARRGTAIALLDSVVGAQSTFAFCKLLILKDWSGRMDLNHRPPGPEPGALARLRYAPTDKPISALNFVPRLAQLSNSRLYEAVPCVPCLLKSCLLFLRRSRGSPAVA